MGSLKGIVMNLFTMTMIRRLAGVPDFLTSEDMLSMVNDDRIDPKMVFSYVQEVLQWIFISPSKEIINLFG